MPSRPVRIVTQGQSDPVRVVIQGIANPVRIVSYTPSDPVRIVMNGISTPVRIVAGSVPVSAPILPDVASATRILDLQSDTLALGNGDPVGTWADASGQGHDFTQSGAARPTFVANIEGTPAVYFFSGPPDYPQCWMESTAVDFADNLASFAVYFVARQDGPNINGSTLLAKLDNDFPSSIGWVSILADNGPAAYIDFVVGEQLEPQPYIAVDNSRVVGPSPFAFIVATSELLSPILANSFINGDNSSQNLTSAGTPPLPYSNDDPIRLGGSLHDINDWTTFSGWVKAILIYSPAPNASDRAAIEAWLAAKYGIAL